MNLNWKYILRDKYDKETNLVSDTAAVVFWFDPNIVQGNNVAFYLNNQLKRYHPCRLNRVRHVVIYRLLYFYPH